jgi:anti-anti-sigma regulatory factor
MTTILRAPPATVVLLDGEIDIATSPAIRESLMAAINSGNVHLAVDMRYRCCGRPGGL